MKITFIETRRVSEDGFKTRVCEAGQSYDLAGTCARDALNKGWAYNSEPEEDYFGKFLESIRPVSREELERILRPVPCNPATREIL